MKKTLYVYGTPENGIFLTSAKRRNKIGYPLIGTTEMEITPVEDKPFPKPMKSGRLIVYFRAPKKGYVLVGDGYHVADKYVEDWCMDCFTDIKGLKEAV
jgi:hypothetical protein